MLKRDALLSFISKIVLSEKPRLQGIIVFINVLKNVIYT